jgi:CheY-like chemotaxis protein
MSQKSQATPDGEVRNRMRILMIKDDPDVQDLVLRMLESLGYAVLAAGSCGAALDLLRDEDADLILSDVVLPDGISGQALAEQVRALCPGIPIIYMSGYPAPVAEKRAPVDTRRVLLTKPFKRQELADAVAAALASK